MFGKSLTHVLLRGLSVWVIIIVTESIHGIARTILLEPIMGDFRARQVSVFSGAALISLITFVFIRWINGVRSRDFILVGSMWVFLTIGFEIMLGRFVMNLSWERVVSDYDLSRGGLLPLGFLAMLFAPWIVAKRFGEI